MAKKQNYTQEELQPLIEVLHADFMNVTTQIFPNRADLAEGAARRMAQQMAPTILSGTQNWGGGSKRTIGQSIEYACYYLGLNPISKKLAIIAETYTIPIRGLFTATYVRDLWDGKLETMLPKAELIANFLVEGRLPFSGSDYATNSSKAVKLVFNNSNYMKMLTYGIDNICGKALYFCLNPRASFEEIVRLTITEVDKPIREKLAVISDAKWEQIQDLAEQAGYKRPQPMTEEKRAAMRQASQKFAARKHPQNDERPAQQTTVKPEDHDKGVN